MFYILRHQTDENYEMKTLDLDILKEGLPGITARMGAFMSEAAVVALTLNGHKSGVILKIEGDFKEEYQIIWKEPLTDNVIHAWGNLRDVVSHASVALSLLLIQELTNFVFFEIGLINTGIDYWISTKTEPNEDMYFPEREARLEISGIFTANNSNTINMRVNLKKKQAEQSDESGLPAYISVIEFSIPKAKIVKK